MKGGPKIQVGEMTISVRTVSGDDYISLTDIVKNFEGGNSIIGNWITTKRTIEFLGLWEKLNNPDFKLLEFQEFYNAAGSSRFVMSPQKWIKTTNAIGIVSISGRYGGTHAHKDIAFEFAAWLSPEFKLLLIKEFQRLKEKERELEHWDYRRFLSKVNYRIHTDAVQKIIIPVRKLPKKFEGIVYAEEGDLINVAVFGETASEWRKRNPKKALAGENMRDSASMAQLTVLANIESYNSVLVKEGINQQERLVKLREVAHDQLSALLASDRLLEQ